MRTSKKEVRIGVRVTHDIKIKLELIAEANKRNLSDYLRIEIEKIVEQNEVISNSVSLKDGEEEK